MNTNFAQRLQTAIDNMQISQTELSDKTGISKASICEYLSGAYEPKQRNIFKLAKALNVKPSYLMGVDDTPKKTEVSLQTPELAPVSEEEAEQMRRNAIARAFMDMMLQDNPEARALIAKAVVTTNGDIVLPGLDDGDQKYINRMRTAFFDALKDATKNGDTIKKITFSVEPLKK